MEKKLVDEYISQAPETTRDIIIHLRSLIKTAYPNIAETIKWRAPSFEVNKKIICSIMGFKKHVNFVFVNGKELDDPERILENMGEKSNMMGIKQIQKIGDLPDDNILIDYIRKAIS